MILDRSLLDALGGDRLYFIFGALFIVICIGWIFIIRSRYFKLKHFLWGLILQFFASISGILASILGLCTALSLITSAITLVFLKLNFKKISAFLTGQFGSQEQNQESLYYAVLWWTITLTLPFCLITFNISRMVIRGPQTVISGIKVADEGMSDTKEHRKIYFAPSTECGNIADQAIEHLERSYVPVKSVPLYLQTGSYTFTDLPSLYKITFYDSILDIHVEDEETNILITSIKETIICP